MITMKSKTKNTKTKKNIASLSPLEILSVHMFQKLYRASYQTEPGVFWTAIKESFRDFLIDSGRGELVEVIEKLEAANHTSLVLGDTGDNLLKAAAFMRENGGVHLANRLELEVKHMRDGHGTT